MMRNKNGYRIISVLLTLSLMTTFVWSNYSIDAKAATTKEKLEKVEEEIEKLENQQNENEFEIDSMKGERNTLRRKLKKLDEQLEEIGQNIENLEQQISDKKAEITETEEALEEAIQVLEQHHEDMILRVKAMYERKQSGYLNAFLGKGGLASLLNAADYFGKVEAYDKEKLDEYKIYQQEVETTKTILEKEKYQLEELKVEAEAEHSKVSGLIRQAQNSISEWGDQISEAEKKAQEYEDAIREKEADREYLKKKLAEEIAKSKQAANSVWRDISEITFEESDRYLLANLIYCEAGGEPYDGQVAVGAVVINRVLSSVFPDNVTGVIYQSGQFSPVGSGRLALALADNKATASCYQAADAAMSGQSNVGNCVFFRTPIEGLTGIQIGGHIFY